MPAEPEPSGPLMSFDEWMESPARVVFEHPHGFVGGEGVERIEIWIRGFDWGSNGGLLNGFPEWCDMKLGYVSPCSAVDRLIRLKCQEWRHQDPVPPEIDGEVCREWLQFMDEFIAERTKCGLPDILERHHRFVEAEHKRWEAEWAEDDTDEGCDG